MPQNPTAVWSVRWTKLGNAEEVLPLYTYDRDTEALAATQYAGAGRALIVETPSLLTVRIEGVDVLTITSAGVLTVPTITYKLNPGDSPRVEFMRTIDSVPRRIASVSKAGILTVDHIMEMDDLPDTTDKLLLLGAAVAEGGVFAPEFVEADL